MAVAETQLIDRLPQVRGRLTADAPLAAVTWFRVGGPAEVLFRPADVDDLGAFLAAKPGRRAGDGDRRRLQPAGARRRHRGVVVRLGRGFADITRRRHARSTPAPARSTSTSRCPRAMPGIAGLEFLSGIPGTIGGALRMNAGAYGREIEGRVARRRRARRQGQRCIAWPSAELGFTYRHSGVPEDWIFVARRASQGRAGRPEGDPRAHRTTIQTKREESQPMRARTGGSTFANPDRATRPGS